MQARQVQVRGCLPAIVALVVIGAVLAAAVTASLAFLAVAAAAGLLAALVRWASRLVRTRNEATSTARRRAADVTIDAEVVEPQGGAEEPPPKRLE
jgi:membrane protein implicated in regulation of membrane protease activity